MSLSWMPLYVSDYLGDTTHLNAMQSGAYLHLIMHYWQRGSLPNDDAQLAMIAKMTREEFSNAKALLSSFFSIGWRHERVERERAKAQEAHLRRVNAGKSGGRPQKANEIKAPTKNAVKQCESNAFALLKPRGEQYPPQPQPDINRDIYTSVQPDGPVEPDGDGSEKKERREALATFGRNWNEVAAAFRLPAIDEIKSGSARERHALALLREFPDPGIIFARIRGSPYLRGEVNGWRCSFDWLIKPANLQKVVEGNYENRQTAKNH